MSSNGGCMELKVKKSKVESLKLVDECSDLLK